MLNLGVLIPIAAILATAWVAVAIMRYRVEHKSVERQSEDALNAARQIELLSSENASLKGQVSRLEERIAVLERIATDPAERTAREIEDLR